MTPREELVQRLVGMKLVIDQHGGYMILGSVDAEQIITQLEIGGLPVLQAWVCALPLMQQTVLLTATRGPDGIRKDHMVKVLLRWLRRSFLYSAMDRAILEDPFMLGGGSFTGPFQWHHRDLITHGGKPIEANDEAEYFGLMRQEYLKHVDELPHHFQLHFMHAAQILGFKHPVAETRQWWNEFYLMMVNDAHLFPESEELMDKRLGDNEANWRAREEVTAR